MIGEIIGGFIVGVVCFFAGYLMGMRHRRFSGVAGQKDTTFQRIFGPHL